VGAKTATRLSAPLLVCLAAVTGPWTSAAADPAAWRLQGKNGGEVTLLGSVHVLRAADYPLPPSVDALFERAQILVMELDLDDVDAVAQQRIILDTALLPQGTDLRDVIDADVYLSLEQSTAGAGIDLALLERFEPWFLAITVLDLGLRKFGFQGEHGIEQYVLREAQRTRKEIVGLETLEFQIGIFDALSPSLQQAMLEQTLAELEGAEAEMTAMADAWREGELEELADELLDEFDEFPGLYATLITERNDAWVETLERKLRDGRRHLVVVGALHLVGRDNVVEGLTARGHEVARIH